MSEALENLPKLLAIELQQRMDFCALNKYLAHRRAYLHHQLEKPADEATSNLLRGQLREVAKLLELEAHSKRISDGS